MMIVRAACCKDVWILLRYELLRHRSAVGVSVVHLVELGGGAQNIVITLDRRTARLTVNHICQFIRREPSCKDELLIVAHSNKLVCRCFAE